MVVGWRSITLYYYYMMNLHGCRLEVYNSILLLHDESAWLEVGGLFNSILLLHDESAWLEVAGLFNSIIIIIA